MSQNTKVLLVPGLYPRGCEPLQRFFYSTVLPQWRADGYDLTVCQFGWNDKLSLATRQQMLLETIEKMPGTICAIGASAGGLAVIEAFKNMPDKFAKIVTVSSPLNLMEADLVHFKNNLLVPIPGLLREVYSEVDSFLSAAGEPQRTKIASLHGGSDPRVLPRWSQRPGILYHELPVNGHGKTIRHALGVNREVTQGFLK